MERFTVQVMLQDGALASYEVDSERGKDLFRVFQDGKLIACFQSCTDGSWQLTDNPAEIDEDLKHRIENQLNGLLQ